MKTWCCLLLLWVVGLSDAAAEAPLGRLFFTPEQRLLLDRQRQYAGAPAESAIRLDGQVTRSDQEPTFWINRRIERDGRDMAAGLRVGESIDPATRRKTDLVPDGSVTRIPRR